MGAKLLLGGYKIDITVVRLDRKDDNEALPFSGKHEMSIE
jgi:hypothetical protein